LAELEGTGTMISGVHVVPLQRIQMDRRVPPLVEANGRALPRVRRDLRHLIDRDAMNERDLCVTCHEGYRWPRYAIPDLGRSAVLAAPERAPRAAWESRA
jgi:hypothetical protein